jgi:hypothetical protein
MGPRRHTDTPKEGDVKFIEASRFYFEEAAKALGLEKVSTKLSNEVFELGAGEEIPSSVLLRNFLFPKWLGPTDENELSDTLESLARMVQEDDTDSSFRFSVKATILTGTRK